MWGMTSTTISPSTTSSSRSTPCVDGCWGPMLRTISSVRMGLPVDVVRTCGVGAVRSVISGMSGAGAASVGDLHPVVELRHLEVLAERVAGVVLGQEDPPEVRV